MGDKTSKATFVAFFFLDVSFCRVWSGGVEITEGPDRLTGRHCPHLWLH